MRAVVSVKKGADFTFRFNYGCWVGETETELELSKWSAWSIYGCLIQNIG